MMPTATGDVLVVDDDADLRESIVEILHLRGYPARACENGKQALAAIAAAAPALVLLDLMMPVLDGWTVLARLRDEGTLALDRVVVMTASEAEPPYGVRALPKPFTVKQLLAVVRDADLLPAARPATAAIAAAAALAARR